ncbi:MAG: hypothetical protein AAB588_04680 [Patescibacteria group bacterium]
MRSLRPIIIVFILLFLFGFAPPAAGQGDQPTLRPEDLQFFGSEPAANESDEGRTLLACITGLRRFLSPPNGDFFEDFYDYIRDFSLLPLHYADVANVENQTNRARYAVIAAYLRCDLNRLKAATDAYFRLEAELYFLRHFVDTNSGIVRQRLVENREAFQKQMMDRIIPAHSAEDEEKDRALFGAYFDQFAAQYQARGESYDKAEGDPIFDELGAKFDKLVDTIATFQDLGKEVGEFGKDVGSAVAEGAGAVYNGVAAFQNPGSVFKDLGMNLLNRLQICPDPSAPADCQNLYGVGKSAVDAFFNATSNIKKFYEKKTFEEVQIAVSQQDLKRTEDFTKAEMLARYELLYGQVNGDGITTVVSRLDYLLTTLGSDGEFGSLKPLTSVAECADKVKGNVCK